MCFLFCRKLVGLCESLHTDETYPGLQKSPGLHAEKWPLANSQPRSQIPAGSPEATLQSQCCVFLFQFNDGFVHFLVWNQTCVSIVLYLRHIWKEFLLHLEQTSTWIHGYIYYNVSLGRQTCKVQHLNL